MDADDFRHFYERHFAEDRKVGEGYRPALIDAAAAILLSRLLLGQLISTT